MRTLKLGTFSPSVLVAVATETGALARAGLTVEEVPALSSPAQFEALMDGTLDAVITNPDNVVAYRCVAHNPLRRNADVRILAALHHRTATGEGQDVDVNLMSSALSALVNQTSAYVAGGVVPQRMGNAHLSLYPYEPMPTGDGEMIIAVGNDRQFRKLVDVLGVPGLADDPRFATVLARNDNRDALRPLLVSRLATKSAQEWFGLLSTVGVPCGPINSVREGVELAESLGLAPVVETDGIRTVRNPIGLSETPVRYALAPPKLDEHGDEIRAWLNG
ncbi:CoA transferase [Kibdelosporangium lantanae]|uniref:CoA transferase n=1 Tax=Kibdelosporangium lantanae TaxID=1497396 RepID=A0ABW3M374_9PSEU